MFYSIVVLWYKKTSTKAVRLGGFLQYLINLFLRLDGDFWKTNLRLLWNNIMKNFQAKHGQCDSINFPEILADLGNYLQIYDRTPCPAVLIVKGI